MTKQFTDPVTAYVGGSVEQHGTTVEMKASQGIGGAIVVHKFGQGSVGTSYVPISSLNVYRTPLASAATTLRVKAGGNANDTAAGTGARSITLQGIGATGKFEEDTIATAGASASAATSVSFLRLFRAFVKTSGTFATEASGSHAATITIENSAGTEDWAELDATDFPLAQTQIGAYTIPLGYTGYVHSIQVQAAANKAVNLAFFKREGVLQTSAPFSAMRVQREFIGIEGDSVVNFTYPLGPFLELTDIGFMGKVTSGTADVSVNFTVCLIKNLA